MIFSHQLARQTADCHWLRVPAGPLSDWSKFAADVADTVGPCSVEDKPGRRKETARPCFSDKGQ